MQQHANHSTDDKGKKKNFSGGNVTLLSFQVTTVLAVLSEKYICLRGSCSLRKIQLFHKVVEQNTARPVESYSIHDKF